MRRTFCVLLAALLALSCAYAAGSVEVKSAKDWAEAYPNQYQSYLANGDNALTIDHVKEYPMIATLYEGMAFNAYYNSARGHTYTLEDVTSTGRPHKLANCLTCKTPDYTALVNDMGVGAYSITFDEGMAQVNEPVSCYNCHGNDVPAVAPTHSYLLNATKDQGIDADNLACGQCHVEYYFDKETKATTLPYASKQAMAPEAILAYYNEMGFADYTNPRTGTAQIKVQHPEFETYLGAGSIHAATFSCADCHMGKAQDEAGNAYVSHEWLSPLQKPELVAANCAACHADLEGMVREKQAAVEARTNAVGEKLVALTEELAKAVEGGAKDEEALNAIRALNRDAQFYWDFVFVENSEGVHNTKLTGECLDQAEALADQALALLQA